MTTNQHQRAGSLTIASSYGRVDRYSHLSSMNLFTSPTCTTFCLFPFRPSFRMLFGSRSSRSLDPPLAEVPERLDLLVRPEESFAVGDSSDGTEPTFTVPQSRPGHHLKISAFCALFA